MGIDTTAGCGQGRGLAPVGSPLSIDRYANRVWDTNTFS
jgi:hypothetical protein